MSWSKQQSVKSIFEMFSRINTFDPKQYRCEWHGLQCANCNHVQNLEPCSNCGSEYFTAGRHSNQYGLRCSNCESIFTTWPCPKCNSSNETNTTIVREEKGCFLATAIYDSISSPEVRTLRRFRDDVLHNFIAGRLFVNLYYIVSPSLSGIISKSRFTKFVLRVLLFDQIVNYIENRRRQRKRSCQKLTRSQLR